MAEHPVTTTTSQASDALPPDHHAARIPSWARTLGIVLMLVAMVMGALTMLLIMLLLFSGASLIVTGDGDHIPLLLLLFVLTVLTGTIFIGSARTTLRLLDTRHWRKQYLREGVCPVCHYPIHNLQ